VATLSIDAKEVARLVARDLADEWVKERCFRHQLLLPRSYLVLTKPLR
jgi:hypothetical protein